MAGLAVQNFISAAVGMAVLIAVIRGFVSRSGNELGNFWADLTRTLLYILLPISVIVGLVLISQGTLQTLAHYVTYPTVMGGEQTLALGPVGSQEIIKELGTNGGGFFNVNSAMPFENPNGLTNFIEMLLILVIPAGLTATLGRMAGNRRLGWTLYGAMAVMFVAAVAIVYAAETNGTPAQHLAGLAGANLEGKEVRFGDASSALWVVITTVASCGAVTSAHDALTGIGGAVPLANMMTGEVIFGGVGSGLYGMLLFVLLAVFLAGLMVGRTPEFLGKKIEAREIKLVVARHARGAAARARCHRGRARHEVRRAVDLQRRPPGLLRDALRLRLAGQQQRLGVRGLHGLRAAQRAGQRGRVRHHVRRSARRRSRCSQAASSRWCSRSPSPARSPASGSRPRARARCAPTRRRSSCC